MAPPWGQKQVAKGVLPAPCAPQVPRYVDVLTKSDLYRVVGGDVVREAVADWFSLDFGAKGAEQAIPNNQHAGVVAIQIPDVGGVMNAMMAWGIEEPLKPARHPVNRLCVKPELVDQTEAHHGDNHDRIKPQ